MLVTYLLFGFCWKRYVLSNRCLLVPIVFCVEDIFSEIVKLVLVNSIRIQVGSMPSVAVPFKRLGVLAVDMVVHTTLVVEYVVQLSTTVFSLLEAPKVIL